LLLTYINTIPILIEILKITIAEKKGNSLEIHWNWIVFVY